MEGQKNRYKDSERIEQWILFFLESLIALTQKLEIKIIEFRKLGAYLNDRQKNILKFIEENQPVKSSDICAALPSYSQAIIKKDLQYMVQEFSITKIGENRGTLYIIKKD